MKSKERIEENCFRAYSAYVAKDIEKAKRYAGRVRFQDLQAWLCEELNFEFFSSYDSEAALEVLCQVIRITEELKP